MPFKFNYNKAADKVATALHTASVAVPAGAEFLLGEGVVNGERATLLVIYIVVFTVLNGIAAFIAGLEKTDDSG